MKGSMEIIYDTLADGIIVIVTIALFAAVVATYLNSNDLITSDMLAKKLSFALKEVYSAGEGAYLTLELPKRYCEIEITQDKIRVTTETGIWKNIVYFLRLTKIWLFFGIEPNFGETVIENPIGKYMGKDFKGKCSEFYNKKLNISFENGEIYVREVTI